MKKIGLERYIPEDEMNTAKLYSDIEAKRQSFQYKSFADMLGIRRASFNQKIRGRRRFKFIELMRVASRLGEDVEKYLIRPSE